MYRLFSGIIGLSLLLIAAGCDDSSLGPKTRGDIQGQVQDAETNAPISGVNITTSPPTSSLVTDDTGQFTLPDIETGNYTITANKTDYNANTVTVSVRENEVTQATIFLQPDESATEKRDSIAVTVVNWANRVVNSDTTYVDVEYQVRNVGEVDIDRYEVYFRIDTSGENFFYEARGDSLQVAQSDIAQFEKFIRDQEATDVTVDDFWFESE